MPIAPITKHIDEGLARLISRYKNKPRFAAWCASWIRQSQDFEDACWQLLSVLDVDTADLPRLTKLGKIVGQPPHGTLEQFRGYVKVRVLVNRSRATAPNLIKIARILLGNVTYTRWGRGAITIEADNDATGKDPDYVLFLLSLAKGGGVRLDLVYTNTDSDDAFSFAPGTSAIADGRGFADNALMTGGILASIR
jgi:hypothetical protein